MKCPHCLENFHEETKEHYIGSDVEKNWKIRSQECPACKRIILHLDNYRTEEAYDQDGAYFDQIILKSSTLIRPKGTNRPPVPAEVPRNIAEDYTEACLVLSDSPKASAALSRRCLQTIIRDNIGIKKRDLASEIQEVIDQAKLPADLLDSIDTIRNIGNFAAHPIKSKSSGEIINVEPGEAEWNLDVLEMMFDYLFIRPAKIKEKRAAMDMKLKDAGKSGMK